MTIDKVGIIGAGTMGNGIAHVFAQAGYSVQLVDVKTEFLDKGLATIRKNLERQAKKGVISPEQVEGILGNISTATELESLSNAGLVIEAANENKSGI